MQTGWLDPAGRFYPCETFEHVAVAQDIVHESEIPNRFLSAPDDVLMYTGWVKITRSLLGTKTQEIFWERRLTDSQIKFLWPYFAENDENISSIAMMRWERELDNK